MSKGSPIVPVRILPDLLAEMDAEVARLNTRRAAEPWNRTAFIVAAINERLDKLSRGRGVKRHPPAMKPAPTVEAHTVPGLVETSAPTVEAHTVPGLVEELVEQTVPAGGQEAVEGTPQGA